MQNQTEQTFHFQQKSTLNRLVILNLCSPHGRGLFIFAHMLRNNLKHKTKSFSVLSTHPRHIHLEPRRQEILLHSISQWISHQSCDRVQMLPRA